MKPLRLSIALSEAAGDHRSASVLARSPSAVEAARRAACIWGLSVEEETAVEPGTRLFCVCILAEDDCVHHLRNLEEVQDLVDGIIPERCEHWARFHEFLANGGDHFQANSQIHSFDVLVDLEAVA